MKYLIILFTCFTFLQFSNAQHLAENNKKALQQYEEKFRLYAEKMVSDSEAVNRYRADSFFTRALVAALKTPYSFYYNFDSIKTISKQYAPDSSFKIFTWQIENNYGEAHQKGAIQMNTADGSLKLFPLYDNADDSENPYDSVRNNKRWIGAIYYKIVLTTYKDKKFYTLLGFDENTALSNRKWVEILTFDAAGNPQFGGRKFQYPNDEIKPKQPVYRFCLEYKKDAKTRLNYDEELGMIIFDHLISESKNPASKHTLVPDGDYEGFKWVDDHWVYVAKIFDYKVDMTGVDPMLGNAPVPMPIKDQPAPKEEKTEKKKKKG